MVFSFLCGIVISTFDIVSCFPSCVEMQIADNTEGVPVVACLRFTNVFS